MNNIFHNIRFFRSVVKVADLLNSWGEVAFIGRSNVGKSTLINAVVNKKICFTSKMPGRTAAINFFSLNEANQKFVVDLPGYGFAAAAKDAQENWNDLIPDYFSMRGSLKMVYLLIDSKVGIMESDYHAVALISHARKFAIILNKIDRATKEEVFDLKKKIEEDPILSQASRIYMVSGKKPNMGEINILRKDIGYLLK